jgi:hypothetical protein
VGRLDRRLVWLLLGSAAVMLVLRFGLLVDRHVQVVAATESVAAAERRLEHVKQLAATVPGKEALVKQAMAELQTREKGILAADTAAQAQAQLLDIIHRVASANGFDARGAEQLTEAKPLGNDYAQVAVAETFTCGIEQLVNFLAALAAEPQILFTNEIHITGGTDKKKNVQVRLTLSGVVSRKLLPAKKGGAS